MSTNTIQIALVVVALATLTACLSNDSQPAVDATANNGVNNGTPNNGTPNNGAPNNGTPNNGTPNNGGVDEPIQDPPPTDVRPQVPTGADIGAAPLFRVNNTTPVFEAPVAGNAGLVLQGVLADADGRRELRFSDRQAGQTETLAAATWNLPATGAVAANGDVLVCWNRLTGGSSPLTQGPMPDPTQGVSLVCRKRTAGVWEAEFRVAQPETAAWVRRVVATPNGFRLIYYADDGWFLVRDDGGRSYAVTIDAQGVGTPEIIPPRNP